MYSIFSCDFQVGLAVGDIDKIQVNALIDRYVMQVEQPRLQWEHDSSEYPEQLISTYNDWPGEFCFSETLNASRGTVIKYFVMLASNWKLEKNICLTSAGSQILPRLQGERPDH